MSAPQPIDKPSPEETIRKLEAFQRCHGNYLSDPSQKVSFHVDLCIPHIRNWDDGTLDSFIRRLDELVSTYASPSRQWQFEQQLSERLHRETPAASELVEGLCSAITLQTPVYIQLALAVLESPALGTSDYAVISESFFNAYATYNAPGTTTPGDHFSHSFLPVAVQARLKQLGQR